MLSLTVDLTFSQLKHFSDDIGGNITKYIFPAVECSKYVKTHNPAASVFPDDHRVSVTKSGVDKDDLKCHRDKYAILTTEAVTDGLYLLHRAAKL